MFYGIQDDAHLDGGLSTRKALDDGRWRGFSRFPPLALGEGESHCSRGTSPIVHNALMPNEAAFRAKRCSCRTRVLPTFNRRDNHRSSPQRKEQNDIFRALADPTRRQVLALHREGEKNAGDLSAHFNLRKPAMSYHFSVLKGSGLILSHREGPVVWYCLNREVLLDIRSWVVDLVRNSK
jgi:ArsR family transcriptional regulator